MIEIENLTISLAQKEIISNLNMSLETASITLISGRNGVGKSTLLRAISGVNKNYSGIIKFQDKEIRELKRLDKKNGISIYFGQNYFDNLTVFENLTLSTYYLPQNRKTIDEVVGLFDLESILSLYPVSLSSGQRQKLALSIAFLNNCKLLLLDEPFNFLDSVSIEKLLKTIKNLRDTFKITVLISSHIENNFGDFFDNVVLLKSSRDAIKLDRKSMNDLYCFEMVGSKITPLNIDIFGNWGEKRISESVYKLFLSSNNKQFGEVLQQAISHKKISISEFLAYETN
jgi:ABC-2 type transport system ATP-binding protein